MPAAALLPDAHEDPGAGGARHWSGASTPGRDLARFGGATVVAAAFSAIQMFVIPRRLDVATYGHYRLFLVYTGYFGLLHLGLADGAFLRWAGRRHTSIARDWRTVAVWLLGLQGVMLAAALALATIVTPLVRLYVIAFAACALLVNVAMLACYALQASGDFHRAGRILVLAPMIFVAFVLVLPVHSLTAVLSAYVASWLAAALYAVTRVVRINPGDAGELQQTRFRSLVRAGLPVMGAGLAAGLSQSIDRVLVSVAVPITSFALYGFASAVMSASNAITQALSRVALSHAARKPDLERERFLGGFLDLIAAAYGVGLVAEPIFERLVAAHVPAYLDALPIVRALTIGLPFWVATHVVLVGTLQSHGLVRRQFVVELTGFVLVAAASGACLAMHAPLWGVAAATTGAAAATFVIGNLVVRHGVPHASSSASIRFVVCVASASAALLIALLTASAWPARALVYASLAALPTWYVGRRAWRQRW